MTRWSNCLIEGVKQKLKDWGNVQLKPFFCIDKLSYTKITSL